MPRKGVMDIHAYVPGKQSAAGGKTLHRLSSNETPLGASAAAIAAMKSVAVELEAYPDGGSGALREAIGEVHGLHPDRIVCGAGSDELLNLLAQAYVSEGDEVVFTEHAFLVYRIVTLANGGVPVVVPERDLVADVDAILAAVTSRTRVVFLANPNNPTGTYLPFDEVRRLHAGLRPDILLVLDAAYAEYVRRNDYDAGLELVSANENVVMTRTFSKIHGLANLRIGWVYCPAHVADVLNRVRGPFNLNGAAIAAGAAAVRDTAHVDQAIAHNERWLPWLSEALQALGLTVTPSVGNFLLVHFPDREGARASDADAALQAAGVVTRRVTPYGFPNALRITIGTADANRLIVDTLGALLNRDGASA